jgi:hypothetical protein
MTARSMTKLMDTFPTPVTPWKPDSMADVHAPHVMPSILSVVVAMCAVAFAGGAIVAINRLVDVLDSGSYCELQTARPRCQHGGERGSYEAERSA